jgi:hypothetical protein
MAQLNCGRFTLDGDTLTGPAAYMEERGAALVDAIVAGQDTTFNLTSHLSPSAELAVLVRLQTDFAGWLGQQELLRHLEG